MSQFIIILLLMTNTLLLGILIILILKYILLKKITKKENRLLMDFPVLPPQPSSITITENELWQELKRCINNEDYERASTIRDILEKIKRDKGELE